MNESEWYDLTHFVDTERDLHEPDELSPIGRYVLADDARERLRDAVIAEVAAAYVDGADHGDLADAYKELITYEDGR